MATIRMWALDGNIQRPIDYICDEKKVAEGCVVSSMNIDPGATGLFWQAVHQFQNGEDKPYDPSEINGYHLQMSFAPGEVSENECLNLAKQWIESCYGNEYDYVLSVHNDKQHMHAHIILNPVSKQTGKKLRVYFKRDIPILKKISDQICLSAGLSVPKETELENKSYYEWMLKGDSQKDIIRKTLDALIPKVSSYSELKAYMQAVGFQIKDSENRNENGDFQYTVNQKLFLKQQSKDKKLAVRLPFQKEFYALIDSSDFEFSKNGEIATCHFNFLKQKSVTVYDILSDEPYTMTAKQYMAYFEDKTKIKDSCSVKTPDGGKFIRTKFLTNEKGEKIYSLKDIKERIKSNNRIAADTDILETIQKYQMNKNNKENLDSQKIKEEFFAKTNIKVRWKDSAYSQMTKYQKYISWKTDSIQKKLDEMQRQKKLLRSGIKIEQLEAQLSTIKKDYHIVSNELQRNEAIYRKMIQEQMNDTLEVDPDELEDWVSKNITPLQKSRISLKNEYTRIQQEIKERANKKKETVR